MNIYLHNTTISNKKIPWINQLNSGCGHAMRAPTEYLFPFFKNIYAQYQATTQSAFYFHP